MWICSPSADAKIVRKEPKVGDGDAKKVPKATRFDPGPQKEAKVPRSICWHWKAEGKCPYGNDCRFSHDVEPDRNKVAAPTRTGQDKKRQVCFKWRDTGDCRVKDCKFSHEMNPCNVCMNKDTSHDGLPWSGGW